jgi:3-hydroxyisobutyrate dehydrogenase
VTAVGFIGLGSMGEALASNLLEAGFDLTVYDIRTEPVQSLVAKGAVSATSCAEVAARSEVVELAVTDDAATIEATVGPDGALAGAKPGSVIVIHSTVHPETIRRVAREAQSKGVDVLDAQMVGGRSTVQAHAQTFMVGGDAKVLDRVRPMLAASGPNVLHMGDVGMGASSKAAQQVLTVLSILAASESFALAEKAGVNLDAFEELLRISSDQTRFATHWQEFKAQRRPDPRPFYRGLQPILKLAFELDVQLPATGLAQQLVPWATGAEGPVTLADHDYRISQ